LSARYVRSFAGKPVPQTLDDAGLIVMGGPMGVYEADRYPFLRQEMALIERAVGDGKPVLGVCLGSQLLAAALGADVYKGPQKEIGWYPITLSEAGARDRLLAGVPRTFIGYSWHGDVFAVPPGATGLASSELTACQAFRFAANV